MYNVAYKYKVLLKLIQRRLNPAGVMYAGFLTINSILFICLCKIIAAYFCPLFAFNCFKHTLVVEM